MEALKGQEKENTKRCTELTESSKQQMHVANSRKKQPKKDSMQQDRSVDYKQKSLNGAPPSLLVASNLDSGTSQGRSSSLPVKFASSLSSFGVICKLKDSWWSWQEVRGTASGEESRSTATVSQTTFDLPGLTGAPMKDGTRQCAANSSSNNTSLHTRLLVEGASLKRQPGPSSRATLYDYHQLWNFNIGRVWLKPKSMTSSLQEW